MTVSDIYQKQKISWRVYNKYFCDILYMAANTICLWINVITMKHKPVRQSYPVTRIDRLLELEELWGSEISR
jgi:hypothetical protein